LPEHGMFIWIATPHGRFETPQEIEDLSHNGEDQAKAKWYDQDGLE
jgi:hypothetical protein